MYRIQFWVYPTAGAQEELCSLCCRQSISLVTNFQNSVCFRQQHSLSSKESWQTSPICLERKKGQSFCNGEPKLPPHKKPQSSQGTCGSCCLQSRAVAFLQCLVWYRIPRKQCFIDICHPISLDLRCINYNICHYFLSSDNKKQSNYDTPLIMKHICISALLKRYVLQNG